MNDSTTLRLAAALGALAVIAGASGAHGLKPSLEALGTLDTFELANRYHFYHVFALLATGVIMKISGTPRLKWAAILFLAGIVCFSGSLYLISFIEVRWIWPVTPLGGVFFIAGWVALLTGMAKK